MEFDKEQEVQETKLEPQVEQSNNGDKVDKAMKWVNKVMEMLNKYSAKKMLQGILIVFVIIFMALFAFKPETIFKSYDEYREKTHNERMDKRTNNTPLIQAELNTLRSKYNASWVSVWELHNNTNNLDGLPFIFASLNYESMNPGLVPIAEEFDDVRLSLYPLSTYLRQHEMWYGDVEELKDIDYTAYYRAKALGIKYLGFRLMDADGSPTAVLSFAYVEGVELPEMGDFVESWIMSSYKINGLLTVK